MKGGKETETALQEQIKEQKVYGWQRCAHGVPNPIIDPVKKLVQLLCDKCAKAISETPLAFAPS